MTKENSPSEVEEKGAEIIKFPSSRIIREVPQEALKAMLQKGELNQINDLVDDICSSIYQELFECGIDTETESFYRDFSYLSHVARATIYRNFRIDHELHPFLDETVKVLTKEEFDKMRAEAERE
jgi:hypothetical protein